MNAISNPYTYNEKSANGTLSHVEWNEISLATALAQSKINEIINEGVPSSSGEGGSSTPVDTSGVISVSNKGNVTLGSQKNVNIEPAWNNNNASYSGNWGDIALKPGDDILFASHHREAKKRDKIVVKNIDGSDNPVKLQMVAGEIELAVGTSNNPKTATRKKDKITGEDMSNSPLFKVDDAKVMDVKILTGNVLDAGQTTERDERGYLKVRAQAIDLRCEKHGGIALQPKGYDSSGNMNKIKFEHGGGDGLEFGTFNSQKTSIFTDEYRFNKDGIWKMAVRETEASGKTIVDEREGGLQGLDATGALKYKKNNTSNNTAKSAADLKTYEAPDDFYDFIDTSDAQTTTKDIINTSAALNNDFIETSLSSKKNLKISASSTYKIVAYEGVAAGTEKVFDVDKTQSYSKDQLKLILAGSTKLSDYIDTKLPFLIDGDEGVYCLNGDITPKISIEAEEEVGLDAKYGDIVVTSGDTIKMEAPEIRLNAINSDKSGGTVNFGATQDVIFLTNKLTKSLNVETATNPTKIKLMILNNYQESVYWDDTAGKFRIPVKHLYLDDAHTTELTPFNYANGLPVYFADGTRVPADYTCFIATLTVSGTVTTTTIYKTGTKGSENVLKKNLGESIATYTNDSSNQNSNTSSLGVSSNNSANNIEFEDYAFDGTGFLTVASEEFVTLNEVSLSDVITIISELKTMRDNNTGPWQSL